MKRKRSEGRGLNTIVMPFMHFSVDLWPVHPAVEPVIVGLVNEKGNKQTEGVIPPGKSGPIGGDMRISLLPQYDQSRCRKSKNNGSQGRPADLHVYLLPLFGLQVEDAMGYFGAKPHIKNVMVNSGNNKVAQKYYNKKDQAKPDEMVWFQKWRA